MWCQPVYLLSLNRSKYFWVTPVFLRINYSCKLYWNSIWNVLSLCCSIQLGRCKYLLLKILYLEKLCFFFTKCKILTLFPLVIDIVKKKWEGRISSTPRKMLSDILIIYTFRVQIILLSTDIAFYPSEYW